MPNEYSCGCPCCEVARAEIGRLRAENERLKPDYEKTTEREQIWRRTAWIYFGISLVLVATNISCWFACR